jgi:hypothetical protein
MKRDPMTQKARLQTFQGVLRKILRRRKYWIAKDDVATLTTLLVLAGPFTLAETLQEMGYSITDQDKNGAIHITATLSC